VVHLKTATQPVIRLNKEFISMSSEITVPELGESILEATVGSWLKQPGDAVAIGDPVVELETEKVNMEIVATVVGMLASILKQEGETVAIGDVLGVISDESAAKVQEPMVAD
jgi:2-oxoglutarate dehydrogenase E2 component (dihydrolipoamide succinyltransferase)